MSRLLEEPEEQTQKSSESPRKSKKSRKISSNVYDFFCDQPSTSEQSQPKSPSKKKQTESKPSGSNIKAGQKAGKVAIDIVDLSKKHETTDKPTVELSTSAHSSLFDEQPYIENPEEPSTSTGFRTCKIDDELFARALRLTDFNDEKTEQDDTTMMYKPKLSSFLSIRKKPRLSKHSDQTDTAESSPRKDTRPKQTDKQTEDEKTSSDTIGTGDKIDLKNIRAEDIRGRIIFKINEVPENQRIVMSTTSKNDRAQRARERLRRKFEEGQNVSPTNTRSRGRNN